ncbi:MAG: UDP-2,3-diacylglucosamine diphosphatase [Ekhidna sp.]
MAVKTQLISSFEKLPSNKKLYFASDFHLGAPDPSESLAREKKIIKWLQHVSKDAAAIFLVGDIFDFWFEYNQAVPKGFVRFQGKIAELVDHGIPIYFFIGNHDLWMNDYFPSELGVKVVKHPIVLKVGTHRLFVGHGDGLGPGDHFYKAVKKVFTNKVAQWFFQWLHPNAGISMAHFWSRKSREADEKSNYKPEGDEEPLFHFSSEVESKEHHDFYIFGHSHQSAELSISANSLYLNLGDWIKESKYLEYDGKKALLKTFNG